MFPPAPRRRSRSRSRRPEAWTVEFLVSGQSFSWLSETGSGQSETTLRNEIYQSLSAVKRDLALLTVAKVECLFLCGDKRADRLRNLA